MGEMIELCAQAQLGMSYSEHISLLEVGVAVTWTAVDYIDFFGESDGKVVGVGSDGDLIVEGTLSKKIEEMTPSLLRVRLS